MVSRVTYTEECRACMISGLGLASSNTSGMCLYASP